MRRTTLFVVAIMLGLAVMLPQSITAQNGDVEPAATETTYRGFLPAHYGKLGMSDAQKEKVYAIQESYVGQIEKLQKQIEQIELKREAEIATLLTPGQQLRLQELREESANEAAQADAKSGASNGGDVVPPKSQ